MKTTILIALILGAGLALISCKKDKEDETNATASINITEPGLNDTIAAGEELHVEGVISGTGELHGYVITLRNAADQAVFLTADYDSHATSYNFHEHWVNTVTDTTIVTVKVDVTEDHDGNHEVKELNVVCLP
ncbi:MAG: hypothetical protein K0R65_456 [Crocinitomicaceae bacterium]|jgi:hypothetical protein|nr:hypothetical protein [Crocinitomicaceae bacterium]